MNCQENDLLLERLYEIAIEQGYSDEEAQHLAKKSFENNQISFRLIPITDEEIKALPKAPWLT
jgi:hypothetical protein